MDDLQRLLDERYTTQIVSLQAAVEAQQTAMKTALTAADAATKAALAAAEKAVDKAQEAGEKRLDNVNEFRGQLADQARTFMPRNESEVRMTALTERIDAAVDRNAERIREIELLIQKMPGDVEHRSLKDSNNAAHMALTERLAGLDLRITAWVKETAGRSEGINAGWIYLLGSIGAIGTIISVVVLLVIK